MCVINGCNVVQETNFLNVRFKCHMLKFKVSYVCVFNNCIPVVLNQSVIAVCSVKWSQTLENVIHHVYFLHNLISI